jgi:hypothetical protein
MSKVISGMVRFALLTFVVCMGGGCTKMLNGGYETDFTECPRSENGSCMSVEEAYLNATENTYGGKTRPGMGRGGPADRYDASYYEGSFPEGDDENNSQKPLEVLIEELKDCVEEKDSKCVASREKEIEAYERKSEDRALARKLFKEDMERQSMKTAVLFRESGAGDAPQRSDDKYMELTLLPYQTETGAMASSRKYWFVVEEGRWDFGPLGSGGSGRGIGSLGRSAVSPE